MINEEVGTFIQFVNSQQQHIHARLISSTLSFTSSSSSEFSYCSAVVCVQKRLLVGKIQKYHHRLNGYSA